jgi:putative PIN family toxin of toxin-antitoxin system
MMRAVIDTNILVSALIRPGGRVGGILRHLRDGHFVLLYTEASIQELVDVLTRPRIQSKYGVTDDDVETVLSLILLRVEPVTVTERVTACRDPKDNLFLEIGVAGSANAIVSGDEDFLVLHPFEGVPILSPAAFLGRLEP